MKVVCGIAVENRKVLLCRRASHKSNAGWWEFPGGKIEAGETPVAALSREISEELGCNVDCHTSKSVVVTDNEIELHGMKMCFEFMPENSTDHDQLEWVEFRYVYQIQLTGADARLWEKYVERFF